ncbi:magnesium transporter CorA family protein [Candidatus Woesearchaeota archaeon]|nr:magnesium transporter CorA family protein [Candidatus Woesearchaeota archaeon]
MLKYLLNKQGAVSRGEGATYEQPTGEDFIFLFIAQPTEHELKKVSDDFGLQHKTFHLFPRATHSKRYSTKPFQFVFVDYFLEKGKVSHTRILFTLEKNFMIVTIPHAYHYYTDLFDKMSEQLEVTPNGKKTISYLLYLWLMEDTEENYDVLEKTEEMITEIEQRLIKSETEFKVNVEEIIQTKRLLFQMTRRFWASAKIIFAIKKGLTPLTLDMESMHLLDDVYDTFHHQLDMASAQKDMLSDTLEIYATMVSNQLARINNNMSNVMKMLTSFTVILMLPTMIAGIYGMNLSALPFAEEPYGFPLLIAVMGILSLSSYVLFRQKGWI